MGKWEYIVGVQLGRSREAGEMSLEERMTLKKHSKPLNSSNSWWAKKIGKHYITQPHNIGK